MEIKFKKPKEVIITPAITLDITECLIEQITDYITGKRVTVVITFDNGSRHKHIVLWEGDSYDAIGQWTDSDVENRVTELI